MLTRLPRPPSREVAVLSAVAFSVAVGFGIVAPVIPQLARHFGVGRGAAGAVVSVFAGMRLVSALGGGRLVDRFGERLVLASGIAIVAVSSVLAGTAQSYTQFIVMRGAGGVGSAMFTVSALSLILRSVPSDSRGRASGFFSGSFLVGGIAGPGVGALLVPHLGVRGPFFLYAGTLAVAGGIGLLRLPRHVAADPEDGGDGSPGGVRLRTAIGHPAYQAALAAQFADTWGVLGLRSTLVPLFVIEGLRVEDHWVYLGFLVVAVINVGMLLPAGRFADRRGRRPVLISGLLICAASMVLLALAQSLPGYLAAMAVLGFGSGMLDVSPGAVVGDVLGGRSGQAVAVYQMSGDLGVVIGASAVGVIADGPGFGAAFLVTAGVFVLAGLLAVRAPETLTRRSGDDALVELPKGQGA